MPPPTPAAPPDPDRVGAALRWVALAGLLTAAGGIAVMLSPWLAVPAGDAPPEAFSDFYGRRRTGLLALGFLNAVGMAVIAAVFAALRRALSTWSPLWADVGLAAGLLTLAMTLAGFVVLSSAAYGLPPPEAARLLTDVGWILINTAAGPPTTLCIAAFTAALARSPYSRTWLLGLGVVVALAHLVVAGAFADAGAMSPTGIVAHVVPCLWFSWVAAGCLVLLRASRRQPG